MSVHHFLLNLLQDGWIFLWMNENWQQNQMKTFMITTVSGTKFQSNGIQSNCETTDIQFDIKHHQQSGKNSEDIS